MSNIRNVANKTMTSANATVSNLRNQISEVGENIINRVKQRGRPRNVPSSNEIAPYDRGRETRVCIRYTIIYETTISDKKKQTR